MKTDYEGEARAIADRMGLVVQAVRAPDQTCPQWKAPCDHVHGDRYRVRLHFTGRVTDHPGRGSLSFDFWNSQAASARGEAPGYYDVLSCVGSDASLPTDPDELMEELGPMKVRQALASCRFTKRLQAFFTEAEIEQIGEIR